MKYKIIRTDTADNQFYEIIRYIAMDSGSKDIALDYLNKLETNIMRLAEFPESGALPRYATFRKRGYRVLIVERHLVFYKVFPKDKTIIIYAVVDGRSNYKNLII